jgi:arginase
MMAIHIIQVPYDSGHRGTRMGRGPLHLMAAGLMDRLRVFAPTTSETIEVRASFVTEIGSAFELHRAVSAAVSASSVSGNLPLVLSGNCNSAIGTVAGLRSTISGERLGVVWFDGHGDCNTPETFTGSFLDAMGLSTLTGRCWQALAATVPGFQPVPDGQVLLIGAHGVDEGARSVLGASDIGHVPTAQIQARGAGEALGVALDRLARQGVTQIYLHLDVDVLDADFAPANQFAPRDGLTPEQLSSCMHAVLERFPAAAATIASYDPGFDREGRVQGQAFQFLERVAAKFAPDLP